MFYLHLLNLLRATTALNKFQPSETNIWFAIKRDALHHLQLSANEYETNFNVPVDFDSELLRYGLVERQTIQPKSNRDDVFAFFEEKYRLLFTPQLDRFLFWVDHKFGVPDPMSKVVRPDN